MLHGTSAKQLRGAIKTVLPSKIAVAFVGNGWEQYISPDHLKEIVLSPTIGSNPKAIEKIMHLIGESNVYLLDNLHSKIYLGTESALLGSANLSDNGFSDSGLLEAGIVLTDTSVLKKLNDVFEAYKASAKNLYPDAKSKKNKLRKLMKQWQLLSWNNLNTECDNKTPPALTDYKSDLDRIHIAWYQPDDDLKYNKEAINGVVPDAIGIEPDDYFKDAFKFHEKDSFRKGDWILCWHCTDEGYPRENGRVSWMPVHHVVPNGFHDDTYTKLVGQAKHLSSSTEPFLLDAHAIRTALGSGKFPALLSLNDDEWRLAPADKVVPEFLDYVRSLIRKGKQK